MKKRKTNTFVNIIKENYLFLLLLIGLTVIISIQGCYPLGQPQFPSPGNCCKITERVGDRVEVKACVAAAKYITQTECAELAGSQGNTYSFALGGSSCLDFKRNPDCGVDATNNKIGCYLDDGSGTKRFYPQANPPESPQPAALGCGYATTRLYKCDQGREVLVEDCATRKPTEYCVGNACTRTCDSTCYPGQKVNGCNQLCPCDVEYRITKTTSTQYGAPKIYDTNIVYSDYRGGVGGIFVYNLISGTETQIPTSSNPMNPHIYENKIVYRAGSGYGGDIYMYYLTNNTERQITASLYTIQEMPEIYKDKIIYADNRNAGDYDIYLYDLTTNEERQISNLPGYDLQYSIYENKIVWSGHNSENLDVFDIYLTDLTTNTRTRIATKIGWMGFVSIYENKIVYSSNKTGNYDIYLYDLTINTERQITTNIANQWGGEIYKDKIVYMDNRADESDIYLYDLTTNTERQITTDPTRQIIPSIYENKIVYRDNKYTASYSDYNIGMYVHC